MTTTGLSPTIRRTSTYTRPSPRTDDTVTSLAEELRVADADVVLDDVAERFLASADLLVSLPQDSNLAIPSKIFEYMRYEASLLALAEPGSATEELLRTSGADVVAPNDEEGTLKTLRDALDQRERGERPRPIAHDVSFSRRTRAHELFDAIEARVLGARTAG